MLKIIYPNNTYLNKMMALMEYDIVCFACTYKLPLLTSDDIAQELRFKLFKQIDFYNPLKPNLFRTWALKVLRNHLKNLNRELTQTHKRKANLNLVSLEKWLEKGKNDDYGELRLLFALKKLSDLEKIVVVNRFIKEISRKKMAEKLKISQYKVLKIENSAKLVLKIVLSS